MKKKLLWVLTLLPIIVTTIVIPFMDDKIPAHYDLAGNIDRWGSKYENYIFPITIIIMTLFWQCFLAYFRKKQISESASDKENEEAANNEKVMYSTAVGMAVMFGIMHYFFMFNELLVTKNSLSKIAIDFHMIMNVLLGIFLIVSGYIMPKAKLNSYVGLRTTWSMANDQTWEVSNRFSGKIFIISGIIISLQALIFGGLLSTVVALSIIVLAAIISVVYSYKVYKRYK